MRLGDVALASILYPLSPSTCKDKLMRTDKRQVSRGGQEHWRQHASVHTSSFRHMTVNGTDSLFQYVIRTLHLFLVFIFQEDPYSYDVSNAMT